MREKKLTLVSVWFEGVQYHEFIYICPDSRGKYILSVDAMNRIYNCLGVHRGDTVTIG